MSSLRFTIVLLIALSEASAQTSSSLLQGAITDSSGAPVPGARVIATQANTETNYSTVANESGNYVLPNVQPGDHAGGEARTVIAGIGTEYRAGSAPCASGGEADD